jgi:hypothetical protein
MNSVTGSLLNVRVWRTAIGTMAISCIVTVGCSAQVGDPGPEPTTGQSTATQAVRSDAEAVALGVVEYRVSVSEQTTEIGLIGKAGERVGSIDAYSLDGQKYVVYTQPGTTLEFEYADGRMSAWVNGQPRGTVTIGESTTNGPTLTDAASATAMLVTVLADPELGEAIGSRRTQTPYFGCSSVRRHLCTQYPDVTDWSFCAPCFVLYA